MKVTTKTWWRIGFIGEDYWMNRALAGVEGLPEDTPADSLLFATRELAESVAVKVLHRYVDSTPGTSSMSNAFASADDRRKAATQVPLTPKGHAYESRYAGEAVLAPEEGAVVLRRGVEVRLTGSRVTTKRVTVDGEVYERVVEELVTSDWFPGFDETLRLIVCMETHYVAE